MPTTPKRSSARCSPRVTTRSKRRKRPTWCSTTPAAFATRPNKRSSAACRISSAPQARARSSECWDAWRNKKAPSYDQVPLKKRLKRDDDLLPAQRASRPLVDLAGGLRKPTGGDVLAAQRGRVPMLAQPSILSKIDYL